MITTNNNLTNLQFNVNVPVIIRTKSQQYVVVKENDDIDTLNPRTDWDGNLGHMVCFHSRYSLGDEHEFENNEDFLQELVRKLIPAKRLVSKLRRKQLNCQLKYQRKSKMYELVVLARINNPMGSQIFESVEYTFEKSDITADNEYFTDAIIECLSTNAMMQLLQQSSDVVMLPLYLMDHSGLSMSTSDFGDRWDSGQVGWIYALKDEAENLWGTVGKDWKTRAKEEMEGEVITYDQMLRGEVYGATVYQYVGEKPFDMVYTGGQPYEFDSAFEHEACWGFFGDNDEKSGLADFVRENII